MDLPVSYRDVPYDERLFTAPDADSIAVYGLYHPETGELRYVGVSRRPRTRLAEHCQPTFLRAKSPKNDWVKSLLRLGLRPQMRIFGWVPTGSWRLVEPQVIADARTKGCRLLNLAEGGQGSLGCILTDTHKEALRAASRRYWSDPANRAKSSALLVGRTQTEETKEKIRASKLGRPRPAHVIEAVRKARVGKCPDSAARDKMSLAQAAANQERHGLVAFGERKTRLQWSRDPRCLVSLAELKKRVRAGMDTETALTHRQRAPRNYQKPST